MNLANAAVGMRSTLPMRRPSSSRVFISHSSKDQAVVRWLAAQVKAAGHDAWVAEWDPQPGEHLSEKVRKELAACDACILVLTEAGYGSVYVAHETGAAVSTRKPVIALVDIQLADQPMGLLSDVEQVRFDRNDLAASTGAITRGLVRLGSKRGVKVEPSTIIVPTQPALFNVSFEMNLQFQVTANQVVVGVCALMLVGGLIYLASRGGA